MTATNHDGHKIDHDGHSNDGHKPWRPQTITMTVIAVAVMVMFYGRRDLWPS